MNTTSIKSLNALLKVIKQEQEDGVRQFAILVHETMNDGKKTRVYEISRPLVDDVGEED